MKHNIIISDLTYMKETCCVAGWNPNYNKMMRLLINGGHWNEKDLKKIGGYSMIRVNTIPIEPDRTRDYPHKSEDTWIDENIEIIRTFDSPKDLAEALRVSIYKNIRTIFSGKLKENSFVEKGAKCPSLGAIVIPAHYIEFYKDSENKLRIKIKDSDGEEYDLRITCRYLRDVLDKEKSLEGLNKELQDNGLAHIRVGLAKPYYQQNNNCFLMCNGVFLY
jgi:hypothetical protein